MCNFATLGLHTAFHFGFGHTLATLSDCFMAWVAAKDAVFFLSSPGAETLKKDGLSASGMEHVYDHKQHV